MCNVKKKESSCKIRYTGFIRILFDCAAWYNNNYMNMVSTQNSEVADINVNNRSNRITIVHIVINRRRSPLPLLSKYGIHINTIYFFFYQYGAITTGK